jgi:hypothetical protein
MHETHIMSTWGAHYLGPVHLEAQSSHGGDAGGDSGIGSICTHETVLWHHKTHIMSMQVAHYVGPMHLGTWGGCGGDGLGKLGILYVDNGDGKCSMVVVHA